MAYSNSRGFESSLLQVFQDRLKSLTKSKPSSEPHTWANLSQRALVFAITDAISKDGNSQFADSQWQTAINQWQELTCDRLKDFDKVDLSASLYSFSKIPQLPQNTWLNAWYHASHDKLTNFDTQALANSLYAHALLGITPPSYWLDAWYSASHDKLKNFKTQELSNSLYALAVMHILGKDVTATADMLKNELDSRIEQNENSLTPLGASQYMLASKVLGWDITPEVQKIAKKSHQDHETSQVENKVANALKNLQTRLAQKSVKITSIEREALHPETLSPADFKITLTNKEGKSQFIYLEVDGHHHFIKNPDGSHHPNGRTLIRNHLMQNYAQKTRSGFTVIDQIQHHSSNEDISSIVVEAIKSAFKPATASAPSAPEAPGNKASIPISMGVVETAKQISGAWARMKPNQR